MPTFFAAYPGNPPVISQTMNAAAAVLAKEGINLHLWEENDICGRPLTDPIFEQIEAADAVVADVTSLNFNVLFEVGYAIARGKRVALMLNSGLMRNSVLSTAVGLTDSVGYESYQNSTELARKVASTPTRSSFTMSYPKNRNAPLYLIEFPSKQDFMTRLISRVKKTRIRYRSFSPGEHIRLSIHEAIENVAVSSGVIIPLASSHYKDGESHNLRAALVSGLAVGAGIPTLLIQEFGGPIPLDVRDTVREFKHPDQINDIVAEFAPSVVELALADDDSADVDFGPLQGLRIGDPMAENELTTLGRYYLQTDQYRRALEGEANLIVGRKGMGKTALFAQVRDRLRKKSRRDNVVVDLKPEGYQLKRLKEEVFAFLSAATREHLITALWEYVLYLEIAYKILEKDAERHLRDHTLHERYIRLRELYEGGEIRVEGDFSERLAQLSASIRNEFTSRHGEQSDLRLNTGEVTELIYKHDLAELRSQMATYLLDKETLWILFDNLDQGWPSQGLTPEDVLILRCLIDASRKIQREMRRNNVACFSLVFIRNDVYELLVESSSDYGKELRLSLDWTDPELLKELVRLRMAGRDDVRFDVVWSRYFTPFFRGEPSYYHVVAHSLMRPRNLIKLIMHCRGYAVNRGSGRIEEDDIAKGIELFSHDLILEASQELRDMMPNARDAIYSFIGGTRCYTSDQLRTRLREGTEIESEDSITDVVRFLLYFGFVGVRNDGEDATFIYDVHYNMKLMEGRIKLAGNGLEYCLHPGFWPALGVN